MTDYRELIAPCNLGAYLDYAATAPIFLSVIDAMRDYELGGRGNPRRGLHAYAGRATDELERSRTIVAKFIGAESSRLVFTKSATEGLNLAVESFTRDLGPEDEVVHTIFDHNSAYLPLKRAAKERGFVLTEIGRDDMARGEYFGRRGFNPALIVIPHVSNVTGEVFPVAEVARLAHEVGAKVIVDGAQAVAHMPIDITDLGADAYVFSAHKMYGPMGVGAVAFSPKGFGNAKPLLEGGGMTEPGVAMLEAGTPNVTGAVGFANACEELMNFGWPAITEHERRLSELIIKSAKPLFWLNQHRTSSTSPIFTFSVVGLHSHDVAQILADNGVAVRAGLLCAPGIARQLNPAGVVRVSIGLGTTKADIEQFFLACQKIRKRVLSS